MQKLLLVFLLTILTGLGAIAQNPHTLEEAKDLAAKENKNILLNFSGSDWCAQCILMKKNIFDDAAFIDYAQKHLVVLHADFPRQKKNLLPPDQQKINNQLADLYNKNGIFPTTLLLTSDGKILKIWEGNPKGTAVDFVRSIETISFK